MPTPEQRAYAAALNAVIKRYQNLEDGQIKKMIGLLQQLRKDISADILGASEFQGAHLARLRQAVEQSIADFEAKANVEMRDGITQAFTTGAAGVSEPLAAVGIADQRPINRALLNTLTDFSAVLIKNISGDMQAKIDAQLRLAALGSRPPFQVMKEITTVLGANAKDGVWGQLKRPEVVKGVAARAEAITRTELTRIYNISHQSRQEEAAQVVPGLAKRWIATGDTRTRPSHLEAHLKYFENPIPVDQAFEVGGQELMYPGDPAGDPEETVNCRCTTVTVVPEIGVISTSLDSAVEKQAKARDDAKKSEATYFFISR